MLVSDDERHITTQIEILRRTPITSQADKDFVLDKLKTLTSGYVATADSCMCQFVPELMQLYPKAIVVCTIRDPNLWARSMGELAGASLQRMLAVMLFWTPCLRYFPQWVRVLHEGRWGEIYIRPGEKPTYGRLTWERHIEWLEQHVPKDRMIYYNVKDGWEPLCKALDLPLPSTAFPKMNDTQAMDDFAKQQITRGMKRWCIVLSVVAAIAGTVWRLWFWIRPGVLQDVEGMKWIRNDEL